MKQYSFAQVILGIVYSAVPGWILPALSYSQNSQPVPYEWNYVIQYVRANKMDPAKGTRAIINEITVTNEAEEEQVELIRFYTQAFDFKTVDKAILKHLIDSLEQDGLTEAIRRQAAEAKNAVEFRLLGKPMRDFEFPDKDGTKILLRSFRDRVVIIELWATWCGPCIKEMPKIPALRSENPAVEFYSISLDKEPGLMRRFVEKKNYGWPIVFGGDQESNSELWQYLNIVAIPKYYTINREGIVIDVADKLNEEFIRKLK